MVLLKELFNENFDLENDRFGVTCNNKSNKTGFKYVSRVNNKLYHQGFCWRYRRELGGEVSQVQGVNLLTLMERVISRGLPWEITDESRAKVSVADDGFSWDLFKKYIRC